MKAAFVILLFIFCSCRAQYQWSCDNDTADQCKWTFRPSKDSINIFVKKGNVLQWFHPSGMTEFYVQLDSYSIPGDKKWYNYVAFGTPSAHVFWEGNKVIIFDYSYNNEKDFL